ncbi:unnamed protein product, partial [Vitis vinifera]
MKMTTKTLEGGPKANYYN